VKQNDRRKIRNSRTPIVGLSLIAALVAGTVFFFIRPARNISIEDSQNSVSDEAKAIQLKFQSSAKQGPTKERLQWAEQLAELTPDRASVWWQLAGTLESSQRITEAIAVYRRALQSNLPERDRAEMRFRLLDHFIFLGDAAAARQELEFFRSRQINSPLIDVAEARLDRMEGHPERALAILNRIWSSIGNSPRVIWLRGRVHLDLGNLQAAADDFNLALVSLPTDEILHFNLAEVYRRLGELQKSQHHHERYIELHEIKMNETHLVAPTGKNLQP
jgi:tetratricopeptide (TPR) repeat protein